MALMNTTHNPKFKRLHRRLGLGIAQTLGHLECLWQYTHSTANPIYKTADVEPSSEWEGEPGVLLAALLAEGWLDARDDGLVEVHDYWENCPQTVRDRIKKREQRAGHVRDMSGTCPGRGGQEEKRKEVEVEKKEDNTPLPPKGGAAESSADVQPAPKPERKQASKKAQPDSELAACVAELPGLWNAVADTAGFVRVRGDRLSPDNIKRLTALWRASDMFRECWRDLPTAFAAHRWYQKIHADITKALRIKDKADDGIPFEKVFSEWESQNRPPAETDARVF